MKFNFCVIFLLCTSLMRSMENQLPSEFLGKEVRISEEKWQKLPLYFNRYASQVVVIQTSEKKYILGQAQTLPVKKRVSSDVKVQDAKDRVTTYSEEYVRFTCAWQELVDRDND